MIDGNCECNGEGVDGRIVVEIVGRRRDVKKGKRGLWAGDLANHN